MQLHRVVALLAMLPALVTGLKSEASVQRNAGSRSLLNQRGPQFYPFAPWQGEFAQRKACRKDAWLSSKVQCYPDLMLLGESKAGTSSVINVFDTHPQMVFEQKMVSPDGEIQSALHGKDISLEAHIFDEHFNKSREAWSNKQLTPYQGVEEAANTLMMHYTPNYIYFPDTPFQIAKIYPNARSISYYIMVREPTARAISGWRFHANPYLGPLQDQRSFGQMMQDGIRQRQNLEACYKQQLLKLGPGAPQFPEDLPADQHLRVVNTCFWNTKDTHDITTFSDGPVDLMHAHVDKGIYVDQCRRWFSLLGRENFMVFSLEEWSNNASAVFLNISRHGGFEAVGPKGIPSMAQLHDLTHKQINGDVLGEPPLPPEEQQEELRAFYAPYTAQFEAYMGKKFW